MIIIPYSVVTSAFVTSLFMLLFIRLSKSEFIMSHISPVLLITLIFFILFRAILPVELPYTQLIRSTKFLPSALLAIRNFFDRQWIVQLFNITMMIWLVGFIINIIGLVKRYINLYSYIHNSAFIEDGRIIDILNSAKTEFGYKFCSYVTIDSDIKSPCEFGFFNQYIFLPDIELSDEDLYYILAHELCHHHNGTNWAKLFTKILSAIFWWNPLYKRFYYYAEYAMDIHCDSTATRNRNSDFKKGYSANLTKFAFQDFDMFDEAEVTNNFVKVYTPKQNLENRIGIIRASGKSSRGANLVFLCLILATLIFSYAFVVQPYDGFSENSNEKSLNEEIKDISHIVYENGLYYAYKNDEIFMVFVNEYDIQNDPNLKDLEIIYK